MNRFSNVTKRERLWIIDTQRDLRFSFFLRCRMSEVVYDKFVQQLISQKVANIFFCGIFFTCVQHFGHFAGCCTAFSCCASTRLIDDQALKFYIKLRPLRASTADGSRDNGTQIVWKHGKLKLHETHHKLEMK